MSNAHGVSIVGFNTYDPLGHSPLRKGEAGVSLRGLSLVQLHGIDNPRGLAASAPFVKGESVSMPNNASFAVRVSVTPSPHSPRTLCTRECQNSDRTQRGSDC